MNYDFEVPSFLKKKKKKKKKKKRRREIVQQLQCVSQVK
jgi:hypothetical protein